MYHSANPDPASRAKVPIIIDRGATVIESTLTVEYLDAKYPTAGAKLYPDDPFQRYQVRPWDHEDHVMGWAADVDSQVWIARR